MKDRQKAVNLLASLLGTGYIPFMPGTFGSIAAYGVYLLLPKLLYEGIQMWYSLTGLLVISFIAVYISGKAEKDLGEDAPQIVIDELCGYFVATLFLPKTWLIGLYALVLFRVFDIAKPFPINRSQRLRGGWGVVIDDLLAGIYANVLLQVLIRIYPGFFLK